MSSETRLQQLKLVVITALLNSSERFLIVCYIWRSDVIEFADFRYPGNVVESRRALDCPRLPDRLRVI